MGVNPEQDVIDAIDALVDEQMAGGEIAHRDRARVVNTDRCSLCGGAWHGDPWTGIDYAHLGEYDQHDHGRRVGCPGASATTGPQRIRWRWTRSRVRTGTFQMVGPRESYTTADLMGMRWSRDPLQPPMVRFWDGNFNLGPWGFDGSRAVLAIEAAPTTTRVQRLLQTLRRWLGL